MRELIRLVVTMALLMMYAGGAYADTTATPSKTPTTLSSVKIGNDGEVISRSPQSTTTTEKARPATTTTERSKRTETTGQAAPQNRQDNNAVGVGAAPVTTTTVRDDRGETVISEDDVVVQGERVENPALTDNASAAGTVADGSENADENKASTGTNEIKFDVKPYIGMAILLMLLGLTVFSRPSLIVNGGGRNMLKKRTRTL